MKRSIEIPTNFAMSAKHVYGPVFLADDRLLSNHPIIDKKGWISFALLYTD